MKNRKTILVLILIFVLLIGGATIFYNKLRQDISPDQLVTNGTEVDYDTENTQQADSTETQKTLAPDFMVYDLEGNAVKFSDFIGKPIVLNFWASWCDPCQSEMPDFNEACSELGDEIHFLMVNMTDGSRETVEKASEFIAEQGYAFPVFYDNDSDAAKTYRVYSLPTTLFIDEDGYAVAQATGAIDRATLQKGIEMITSKGEKE